MQEGSELLGVTPQRLHMLREEALQAALERLEPRPVGRPRQSDPEDQTLAQEVARLRRELEGARLREEMALLLPLKKKGRAPG